MTKWKAWTCLIMVGLMAAGFVLANRLTAQAPAPTPRPQQGQRQPTPPPPNVQAAQQLQAAYGGLELVSIWSGSGKVKLGQDQAALFEQAKGFYRRAHQAYTERSYPRSVQLALAAGAASQGLVSILHADAPAIPGLPKPPDLPAPPAQGQAQGGAPAAPQGPADEARQVLELARQRITDASKGGATPDTAKAFVEASRKVYEQSRNAYQQRDYPKAIELALAAEAWTHIGEHLRQADNPGRPGTQSGQPAPARPRP